MACCFLQLNANVRSRGAGLVLSVTRIAVQKLHILECAGKSEARRAGKKCRLVDNIKARLGSEANFGSHKIKISS